MSDTLKSCVSINIEDELKKSYLDYAMSVIVGRALPDVRDGLKPVHRRILYAMRELGNYHNRPYLKSARIVGDVIGKYHPHGDSAVYDAIVRMAQNFSLRYLLVDGQGNFGSLDGDSPAAMRYTEIRMAKIVQDFLQDIDKETVDFTENYDNSLTEPTVLPCKVPNILMNGSSGIAVGMATNIPPHNVGELARAIIILIDNPSASINMLMNEIIGPDFPTAAIIAGKSGIREAYETGRGTIIIRSRIIIEQQKNGTEHLIVTEIPYQQNKSHIIERIGLLVRDKKITGITEIRDESDRHGVRIVMELRRDEVADIVINQLYKLTQLQKSFGIQLLAIVNNRPQLLNLKQILELFIYHRKTVVYKRSQFELKKCIEHLHILEGLKIALENIDEVIRIIRSSSTPLEAKELLLNKFGFSLTQCQTILEMRLQRLTALEREKIISDYIETQNKIKWLKDVLSSEAMVLEIINNEMIEIIENYGDQRKTEIIDAQDEILPEDMITPEDMVVTVTHKGYIKRNPVGLYKTQRRGGKGVRVTSTIEDDFVTKIYLGSTLDTFLFFTNIGKIFWRKVYQLPLVSRISRGKSIVNLLEIMDTEQIAAILPVDFVSNNKCDCKALYILMVTKYGLVKKTPISEFEKPIKRGKIALTFRDDDEIISAELTSGKDEVFLFTKNGKSIRFNETDVRPMGRIAAGVRGISLDKDDVVVGSVVIKDRDTTMLMVTSRGYGKRSHLDEYRLQKRGGRGVIAVRTNERNGYVAGAIGVKNIDELMVVTNSGKTIRINMDNVRIIGRTTQGVRLINLEEGDSVVDIAFIDSRDDDMLREVVEDFNE